MDRKVRLEAPKGNGRKVTSGKAGRPATAAKKTASGPASSSKTQPTAPTVQRAEVGAERGTGRPAAAVAAQLDRLFRHHQQRGVRELRRAEVEALRYLQGAINAIKDARPGDKSALAKLRNEEAAVALALTLEMQQRHAALLDVDLCGADLWLCSLQPKGDLITLRQRVADEKPTRWHRVARSLVNAIESEWARARDPSTRPLNPDLDGREPGPKDVSVVAEEAWRRFGDAFPELAPSVDMKQLQAAVCDWFDPADLAKAGPKRWHHVVTLLGLLGFGTLGQEAVRKACARAYATRKPKR